MKLKLLEEVPSDRNAYTAGKTDVVVSLLANASPTGGETPSS